MSEINPLVVALILPVAAGVLFIKMAKSIGSNRVINKENNTWPCTIEREELLVKNYNNELTKLNDSLPSILEQNLTVGLELQENHLKAMLRSIEKIDIMSEVLNTEYNDQYLEVQSNIEKISMGTNDKLSRKKASKLISKTDAKLRNLTLKAHSKLSNIETEATSEIITDTMKSLGYRLKNKGNLVAGSLGQTSMRAEILSGGKIILDTTSFRGLSCHKEVTRFEQRLKGKGIVVKRLLNFHEKRCEGVLLKDPFPKCNSKSQKASNKTIGNSTKELQNFHLLTQNLQKQRRKIREC